MAAGEQSQYGDDEAAAFAELSTFPLSGKRRERDEPRRPVVRVAGGGPRVTLR